MSDGQTPEQPRLELLERKQLEHKQLEQRVEELERSVAHLDAAYQDMSEMVARQWETIDRLTHSLLRVHSQVQDLQPEIGVYKPPHY